MPSESAVDMIYAADQLSTAELDALPYGMIQLDSRGVVLRYSQAEAQLSGRSAATVVGRHFFDDVAPCTHVREFYGRFQDGVAAAQLDTVFNFRFAFVPPRDVRVHMFYSRVTRSVWVKVVTLDSDVGGVA
jgi:photoactive yellow protein